VTLRLGWIVALLLLIAAPPAAAAQRPDLSVKRVGVTPRDGALRVSVTHLGRGSTLELTLRRRSERSVVARARRRGRSGRFTWKLAVAPGTWTVTACADAARRIRERNERNNCRTSRPFAIAAPTPWATVPTPSLMAGATEPAPAPPPLPVPTPFRATTSVATPTPTTPPTATPTPTPTPTATATPTPTPTATPGLQASFTFSPAEPLRGTWVHFTSTSTGAVQHEWDLYDDGRFEDGTAREASRWFAEAGTFAVHLRVTGADGQTSIATRQVTIKLPPGDLPRSDEAVTWQQNPAHDGRSESAGPQPPLETAWSRTLPGTLSYPVMAGDRVFVTQAALNPEVADSAVFAFDRRTGETLWTRRLATRHSNLAYGDGRLYALGDEGVVVALDPATGTTLWSSVTRDTGEAIVLHANGMLFTSTQGIGWAFNAFDADDGAFMWSQQMPGGGASTMPTADGNNVYIGFPCPGTFAMEARHGWPQWWKETGCSGSSTGRPIVLHAGRLYDPNVGYDETEGQIRDPATGTVLGRLPLWSGAPAFIGDRGFFVVGGRLQARDLVTGALIWDFAGDGSLAGSPLIAGGHVFIRGARLYAVDLETGTEAWRSEESGLSRVAGKPSGMAIASGTLVVPEGGRVTAYRSAGAPPEPGHEPQSPAPVQLGPPDPGLGETRAFQVDNGHGGVLNVPSPAPPLRERWRVALREPTYALVADGRVYVVTFETDTGRLHALDQTTGATLWSRATPGGNPAFDAGRVFVLSVSGLSAFDADTGTQLWRHEIDAWGSPVAADGAVYINLGGSLARFRQSDGTREWVSPGTHGSSIASPALDDTHAYGYNACRTAYAVDRQTGASVWSNGVSCGGGGDSTTLHAGHLMAVESGGGHVYDARDGRLVDSVPATQPIAARGNLALGIAYDRLHAYEFPTWRERWEFKASRFATAPLMVGRHAYVATRSGNLYALDVDTGQTAWSRYLSSEFGYSERGAFGLSAGDGLLLVPTANQLIAFESDR
jgi:outer membrane protein assembly factor BamB